MHGKIEYLKIISTHQMGQDHFQICTEKLGSKEACDPEIHACAMVKMPFSTLLVVDENVYKVSMMFDPDNNRKYWHAILIPSDAAQVILDLIKECQ